MNDITRFPVLDDGGSVRVSRVDDEDGAFVWLELGEATPVFMSFSLTVAADLGRRLVALAEQGPP